MANELNELQTESRRIHPETLLFWFSFFWMTVGWRWWAQTNPDVECVNNPLEPSNMFLKFFMCAAIFFCVAGVQFLLCYFAVI